MGRKGCWDASRGLLGFGQERKGNSEAQGQPQQGDSQGVDCVLPGSLPREGQKPASPGLKERQPGLGRHARVPRRETALGRVWSTGAVCSSPTTAHVPSSLVRTGVTQLKAGSFLRVPTLHLL